ncbi:hypothetical protein BGW38_000409 [Lunasporangiospora selenospora]|uniref:F-box domain-containing protein n=1 Tax=Lunasporangiospora selenospora TaxID=979761 RepID=A0A9P6G239_9FUNG|nr:hypothetical protein BGW38_000409 [Lunasporangiospora selenospora]
MVATKPFVSNMVHDASPLAQPSTTQSDKQGNNPGENHPFRHQTQDLTHGNDDQSPEWRSSVQTQEPVFSERQYVLASPPTFTYREPHRRHSHQHQHQHQHQQRRRKSSSDTVEFSPMYSLQSPEQSPRACYDDVCDEDRDKDGLNSLQSHRSMGTIADRKNAKTVPTAATSSVYEKLLQTMAQQRSKLNLLQDKTHILTQDLVELDQQEQVSFKQMAQGAENAVEGWNGLWDQHSTCEPFEVQFRRRGDRPAMLAALVQEMSWLDRKLLLSQLVQECGPRHVYFLQSQISRHHGDVCGFDLLSEFPENIASQILRLLSFSDLSRCRLVSRSWNRHAVASDVVYSAIQNLTYPREDINISATTSNDRLHLNWNMLCRFHERDQNWINGRPASVHSVVGHGSYVTSIRERGDWIVTGGYDEKVRLWEAASGRCSKIWDLGSVVSCVELFVDNQLSSGGIVVAAFVDIGLVKMWSLHGPLEMHTLTGHQKGVRAMTINETYLVTAGFDQTVLVWNWRSCRKVASFRAHNEVILGVHLSGNTVFSCCIDATLRVYDIPSKTLLHQVRLFEVQPGVSLQWSCLDTSISALLLATNKRIYVWHLEDLESLVHQQRQVSQNHHQHHQQQHLYRTHSRPESALSYISSTSLAESILEELGYSAGETALTQSLGAPSLSHSPGRPSSSISSSTTSSRSGSCSGASTLGNSSFNSDLLSDTTIAALSVKSPHSTSSSSLSSLLSSISSSQAMTNPQEPVIETRVRPCLTAILTIPLDTWCGNIIHRPGTPLLILGSRTSTNVKVMAISLGKDIIDPNRAYGLHYKPLLLSPKGTPIQNIPVGGAGRGVMCIDSSASKLVVGCTGGQKLAPSISVITAPIVITVPQLSPTQLDSIRSVCPTSVHPPLPYTPSSSGSSSSSSTSASGIPSNIPSGPAGPLKKSPSSSSTSSMSSSVISRVKNAAASTTRRSVFSLASPCPSPKVTPSIAPAPSAAGQSPGLTRISLGSAAKASTSPPRIGRKSPKIVWTPPSEYEGHQEVLMDLDEDCLQNHRHCREESFLAFGATPPEDGNGIAEDNFEVVETAKNESRGEEATDKPSPRLRSSSTTLSNLSRLIPSSPIAIRRRSSSSSTSWTQQFTKTTTAAYSSKSDDTDVLGSTTIISTSTLPTSSTKRTSIMAGKSRNRSAPDLLGKATATVNDRNSCGGKQSGPLPSPVTTSSPVSPVSSPKTLSKSWSWTSSRRLIK